MSSSLTIEVDDRALMAAFRAAPEKTTAGLNRWIRKTALRTEREAKLKVPVDTGVLQNSIHTIFGQMSATVKPTAKYALYVHEGTGIYARNGSGRKTPWFVVTKDLGGGSSFGFWTHGNKPQPFMENAYRVIKPQADRDASDMLNDIVRSI